MDWLCSAFGRNGSFRRIDPNGGNGGIVRSLYIGSPTVADHERFAAARIGRRKGVLKYRPMWFVASGIFAQNNSIYVGR